MHFLLRGLKHLTDIFVVEKQIKRKEAVRSSFLGCSHHRCSIKLWNVWGKPTSGVVAWDVQSTKILPANGMLITPRQQSCSKIFYAGKFDILLRLFGFTFCAKWWMDGVVYPFLRNILKFLIVHVWMKWPACRRWCFLHKSGWSGLFFSMKCCRIYVCNVCVWIKWLR